jgi:hypothetical protein
MPRVDMTKSGKRGISLAAAATGFAALAVVVAGPAHADDLNTTTCSEQQILASMQKNDPVIWANISSDPKLEQQLEVGLTVLLATPPGQRQQQVNSLEGILGYERWASVSNDIMDTANGPIGRAVNNCHSA